MDDREFAQFRATAVDHYTYLQQGDVWRSRGRGDVQIADMAEPWRRNAAALMVRNAAQSAEIYSFGMVFATSGPLAPDPYTMAGEALDHELADVSALAREDPARLIRATPLHQALVRGMRPVSAELVGPLRQIWFRGRERLVADPPRDTLDPRWQACADHRTACDCREAEHAEIVAEYRATVDAIERAAEEILAGHTVRAWSPDGSFGGCQCSGCRIVRAAHILVRRDKNGRVPPVVGA